MNQVFKHTHYLLRPCKKSDLLLCQRLFLLLLGIWSFGTINTVSVSLDAKIWMLNGPSLQSMQSQLSNSNLTHKSLASHLLFIQSILSQFCTSCTFLSSSSDYFLCCIKLMCSVHFIDSIAINSADRSNSLSDHVLISFLCGGESSTESGSGHLICTHRQIWSGDSLAHFLKQTQSTDTCSIVLMSCFIKQ